MMNPNECLFTGGPLDGQTRIMEVYIGIIPVKVSPTGILTEYYTNVNATSGIDQKTLQVSTFVHYVYRRVSQDPKPLGSAIGRRVPKPRDAA